MMNAGAGRAANQLRGMASTGWQRPAGLFDNFTAAIPPLLAGATQPEDRGLFDEEMLRKAMLLAPGWI